MKRTLRLGGRQGYSFEKDDPPKYLGRRPRVFDVQVTFAGARLTVEELFFIALEDPDLLVPACDALVDQLDLASCLAVCRVVSVSHVLMNEERESVSGLGYRLFDRLIDAQPEQTRRHLDDAAAAWLAEEAPSIGAASSLLPYAAFEARKRGSVFPPHVDAMLDVCLSELPDDYRNRGWWEILSELVAELRRPGHPRSRRSRTRAEIMGRMGRPKTYHDGRPRCFDERVSFQGEARTVEIWWWLALRGYVRTADLDALFGAWLETVGPDACFEVALVRTPHGCPGWVTTDLPPNPGHGFSLDVRVFRCMLRRDAAAAGALLDRAVEVWPQGRSEWTPVSERLLVLGQVDALLHGGAYRASTARLIDEVRCTEHHRAALWVAASHDSLSTITAPISPPLPPLPADATYDQRLTRALTLGELGETDASQSMLTALADQPAPSPRLATFVEAARAGDEVAASLAHLREAVALLPCSAAASNALLRARVVLGDPEGAWAEKERLREARLASPDTASV
ncbi:MAG: hypothetical protein EVA89_34625 [Sandaracinaceae bacterium]|nr:MAG: hypothetical protein EVA89_34625 [Sandaracinaceae bacterium]